MKKVKFEDINVSEALVYFKLIKHILRKQYSLKEVRGFLQTPKNGKRKHMTHQPSKVHIQPVNSRSWIKRARTTKRMTEIHGF